MDQRQVELAPDQSRADRAAGRSLHRGTAHYHRGNGRRAAEEAGLGDAGWSRRGYGRHGRHGLLTRSIDLQKKKAWARSLAFLKPKSCP